MKEALLLNGDTIEFPVLSDGTVPLRVTICWTDPPGQPPAAAVDPPNAMLVNDLDVRIVRGETTFQPWVLDPANRDAAAVVGDNVRDNVEQVFIANPTPGEFLVRVSHKGTLANGQQRVSIIISGNVAQPAPPLIMNLEQTGPEEITISWPAVVGRRYQLQYKEDVAGPTWTNEGGEISAVLTTVAVPLPMPMSVPHRYYQVVQVE